VSLLFHLLLLQRAKGVKNDMYMGGGGDGNKEIIHLHGAVQKGVGAISG